MSARLKLEHARLQEQFDSSLDVAAVSAFDRPGDRVPVEQRVPVQGAQDGHLHIHLKVHS